MSSEFKMGATRVLVVDDDPSVVSMLTNLLASAGFAVIPLQIPGATMADIEREAILRTLEVCGGSTTRAAELLGISVRTIQYRLHEYGRARPAHAMKLPLAASKRASTSSQSVNEAPVPATATPEPATAQPASSLQRTSPTTQPPQPITAPAAASSSSTEERLRTAS